MNRSVLARQMFAAGGAALKPIPAGNAGLPNLPESVRNNMGYMQYGGAVGMQMGGEPQMALGDYLGGQTDELAAEAARLGISKEQLLELLNQQAMQPQPQADARLRNPDMANYIDESGELFYDPASDAASRKQMFDEAAAIAAKYQQPVGMAMGGDPAMAQGVGSMMAPPPAMPEGQGMAEGQQMVSDAINPQVLEGMLSNAQESIGNLDEAEDYETVINTIRGDEMSLDARYAELAEVVGEEDAAQTPESVLTLVQPAMVMGAVDQGIGGLAAEEMAQPVQGAMAQGIMSTVAPPPPAAPMPPAGMGGPPPVNFNQGGLVRRGDNQPVQMMQAGGEPFVGVPGRLGELARERMAVRQGIIGDPTAQLEEQKNLTQAQMLFDIAGTALAFAAPMQGETAGMSPAERLAMAATQTKLLPTIGARAQQQLDAKKAVGKEKQALQLAALGSAETSLAAEAKAAADLKKEELVQAGATSRIKLSDKLNLATKTALSELGYAQKLGLQEAAAGQQMDLQKFLQDGRLSLAEYNATERKKLENVMQKNRADLATLRGSIDFNSRTDLQAQAADIAKQQAELQSELRINELGVGLENSKVLSDYRAGLTAEAAELDRSFREEQAALDREQKATGLDLSERQLALDEKYKLGKLAIDQKAADEVKLGSEAKSAQLRFLTDPDRRRKYVTGELGDETALYEQALIEYAKPSFTWNGTSYVKSATPELAPALQQTIRDRKANGFETPKLPGVKIKTTVEADPVDEAAFDSTEFKQSLIKDGAVNFDSPAWDRIPETVITSGIAYERATGISEIPTRFARKLAEWGRELNLSEGPTEDQSELTTAERDILNLKEEILQVVTNMSDDRVLKATQDAIRANAEPFTPGTFKFDETAAATLNGLKKQLGRAFAFYAEKDPLYNPESKGLYDEDQVTKYRSKASGVRSVLKDVITLENAYNIYFDQDMGSKESRKKGRKASDGGVTAQDIISNLAKGKE